MHFTKRDWLAVFIGVVLVVIVVLIAMAPSWLWHPLGYCTGSAVAVRDCKGYNIWSGIASDVSEITLPVSLIAGILFVRRFAHEHFECHEETCHKMGVHRIEGTPHRVCWAHHPLLCQHPRHGVPMHVIHARHDAVQPTEEA